MVWASKFMMLQSWRHNFARRGDLGVALLLGAAIAASLVVLGIRQTSHAPMEQCEVFGSRPDYLHVILTASQTRLASASIATRPTGMGSGYGKPVEIEELHRGLRRICIREFERPLPADVDSHTSGVSLRSGWPLRVELIGNRTTEFAWEIRPSWLGITLIEDGQTVGTMPYRPAILPLLANILLFALPIVILLGLIRTQIALVRAARGNCTACGYPRPKTICPECGREHSPDRSDRSQPREPAF